MRIKVLILVIQFCLLQNLTFGQSESHLFVHPEFINPSLGLKDSTSQLKSSVIFTFPEANELSYIQTNQASFYLKKLRGSIQLTYNFNNYTPENFENKAKSKFARINYSRVFSFDKKKEKAIMVSGGFQYKNQYYPSYSSSCFGIHPNFSFYSVEERTHETFGGNIGLNYQSYRFNLAYSSSYFKETLENYPLQAFNKKQILHNIHLQYNAYNKFIERLSIHPFLNVFVDERSTYFTGGLKVKYKQQAIGIANDSFNYTTFFADITVKNFTLQLSYSSILSEWQKTFSNETSYYNQNHHNLAAVSLSYSIGAKK